MSLFNATFTLYKHPPLLRFSPPQRFIQYSLDLSGFLGTQTQLEEEKYGTCIRVDESLVLILTEKLAFSRGSHCSDKVLSWLERCFDTRFSKVIFSHDFLQQQLLTYNGPQKGVEVVYHIGNLRTTLSIRAEDEAELRSKGLMESVGAFADKSMGMDLKQMKLQKVACSGFVFGDSKVKIFEDGASLLGTLETLQPDAFYAMSNATPTPTLSA